MYYYGFVVYLCKQIWKLQRVPPTNLILGVLRTLPYIDLKYVDSLEDFTSDCTAHKMFCSFHEKTQERQWNIQWRSMLLRPSFLSSSLYSAGGSSRAVGPKFLLRFPEILIQLQNYNFRTDRLFLYYLLTNKECVLYIRAQNISHVPLLIFRLHKQVYHSGNTTIFWKFKLPKFPFC
jgi:hypothetical protein